MISKGMERKIQSWRDAFELEAAVPPYRQEKIAQLINGGLGLYLKRKEIHNALWIYNLEEDRHQTEKTTAEYTGAHKERFQQYKITCHQEGGNSKLLYAADRKWISRYNQGAKLQKMSKGIIVTWLLFYHLILSLIKYIM